MGYIVTKQDAAQILYDGTVPPTTTQITWKSTVSGVHIRVFVFLFLLAFLTFNVSAQTTVNLNATDTSTQVWKNGTWKVTLKQAAGTTGGPPFNLISGGGLLIDQGGALNGSGNATVSLPANVNIAPAFSVWSFTVCPNASSPCFTQDITVTTTSPMALNLTPPPIVVNVLITPPPVTAYVDGEISGAVQGTIYYNTTTFFYRQCNAAAFGTCTTWVNLGGTAAWSSITGFPPACPVGEFVTDIQPGTCAAPSASAVAFNLITSGSNTSATMSVGTGATLTPTGSGVIQATTMPFSGLTSSTNTVGAMVVGSGASLGVTGTGTITATNSATGTVGNCVQLGTGRTFTTTAAPCVTSSGGTVTSFSAGNLSPLFNSSVATATTTPALTFSLISQSANLFFASPAGGSGVGSFRAIAANDVPTAALPASTSNCSAGQFATGFNSGGTMICSTPFSGVSQIQFLRITSGICSTSGGETTCTMGPFSWPSSFSGSSYAITCTPTDITGGGTHPGIYSLRWFSRSATQFSLTMQAGSNSAAGTNTTSEIDCIGVQ